MSIIQHAFVTLHLPGYGDINVRLTLPHGDSLDQRMRTAVEYEGGWMTVDREVKGEYFPSEGRYAPTTWQRMQVNLSHFAMVTQTSIQEVEESLPEPHSNPWADPTPKEA